MELIEVILSKENLNRAYKKVVANKGASGVDGIAVEELGDYIRENKDVITASIRNKTYMPKPVRRVYIPKDNGKQRPLGITTALDRTIQQALCYLNWKHKNRFSNKEIFKVANSRLGWYKRSGMNMVNFIISKDLLENRIKDGAGLLNPLSYYLVKVGI